ncbi:MAG: cytochrome C [Spirochaetia bacterium]|nr:cytochrome C [Spirochaetia bacterium]
MKSKLLKVGIPVFLIGGFTWVMMGFPPNPRVGYAPEQPIKYSHKLHAGQYNIDCQYCHTTVTMGKKAAVPSLNICFNCHEVVGDKGTFNTGDKNTDKLYEGEVEKLRAYWDKNQVPNWIRIHNLPDHVRFSHQPHIHAFLKPGQPTKEVCKLCHGDIASMEVVRQDKPVNTMGFCISCHRDNKALGAQVNCSTCHY